MNGDDDQQISDMEAVFGCLMWFFIGICVLAGFCLCFTSCSSPRPSEVEWTRRTDGKETLSVTYDPGNHFRIGNISLAPVTP